MKVSTEYIVIKLWTLLLLLSSHLVVMNSLKKKVKIYSSQINNHFEKHRETKSGKNNTPYRKNTFGINHKHCHKFTIKLIKRELHFRWCQFSKVSYSDISCNAIGIIMVIMIISLPHIHYARTESFISTQILFMFAVEYQFRT